MRLHLRQFIAIAWLAVLEAVRQPIVLLLTVACLVFVGLMPVLITHVLSDAARMVRDSALALHFVSGLVLGVFIACSSLRYEVRSGTASSVLSKPVARPVFFLAKFSGLAAVTVLYSLLMGCATLLATRTASGSFTFDWWGSGPLLLAVAAALLAGGLQNFLLRRPFVSRAWGALLLTVPAALLLSAAVGVDGQRATFASALPLAIVPASVLLAMAIVLLAGIAVSLATRLDVIPTLAVCFTIFMSGLMADYLLGRAAGSHPAAAVLYHAVPNFQHFWAVDALAHGRIPWSYAGQAGLYAALYLLGVLSAGIFAFRRMELRG